MVSRISLSTDTVSASRQTAPPDDGRIPADTVAVGESTDNGTIAADLTGYGEKLTAQTGMALLSTQESGQDQADDLLGGVDTNDDGTFDAKDQAKLFLQSEQEAATRRQERTAMDSQSARMATRDLDANHDGILSREEKIAAYE